MRRAIEPYKPPTGGRFTIRHKPTELNDWYTDRGWHNHDATYDTLEEAVETLRSWTGASREWFTWQVYDKRTGREIPDPTPIA